MDRDSRDRRDLRRITVINLDSLEEGDFVLLEAVFGPRQLWPIFQWDIIDEQWQRDDSLQPLDARR